MNSTKKLLFKVMLFCMMLTGITQLPKTAYADSKDDFVIENGVLIEYKGKDKDVVIPYGVTSIGEFAFFNHISITSISIPNSVTSIGDGAFGNCQCLTSIIIPSSVTNIKGTPFDHTVANIIVEKGNKNYIVRDNILFKKTTSGLMLVWYFDFNNNSVNISNDVTSIGDWAFSYCEDLTNITIPNSVTSIGEGAFFFCRNLSSLIIPDSVLSIGERAFESIQYYEQDFPDFLTIYCHTDSYLENYAKRNGITYVITDSNNNSSNDLSNNEYMQSTPNTDTLATTSSDEQNNLSHNEDTQSTPNIDTIVTAPNNDQTENEDNNTDKTIEAKYIMQKDQIKYKDPTGKVRGIVYFQYPQFKGTSTAIKKINKQLKNKSKKALKSKTAKNIKKYTKSSIKDGTFNLYDDMKLYWKTSCKVSYNKNNIISLHMTDEWFGGGVGNTSEYGLNYNLKTGKKLTTNQVILGNAKEKILEAAKEYCGSDTNAYNIIKNKTNYDFYFGKGKVYICFKCYELERGNGHDVFSVEGKYK